MERLENNKTIPDTELNIYKENYLKSIHLIEYICSDKLDSLEMAKKIWTIKDLDI